MQKRSRFFIILGLLYAIGITAAFGQSVLDLKGYDATQPVEIQSDTFFVNRQQGRAEFSGNVVAVQGGMTISADVIIVEYADQAEAGSRSVNSLTATGNVRVRSETNTTKSDKAVYAVGKRTIILEGQAEVTQDGSVVSGDKITINLADDTILIEGNVQSVFDFTPANPKE